MALFAIVQEPGKNTERKKRYDELRWWGQAIIAWPWIWEILFPASFAIWGLLSLLLAFVNERGDMLIQAFIGFGITAAYLFAAFEIIKEDKDGKPQFGLLEVFGQRLPVVFNEGLAMKIPGVSRIVRRSKEQFNEDIEVSSIKCRLKTISETKKEKSQGAKKSNKDSKEDTTFYEEIADALSTQSPPQIKSGGSVKFSLGVTFERDWRNGWAVLEYDDIGETAGFRDISTDAIEADLREVGRRLTWLEAMFATDLISAYLVRSLTGKDEYKGKKIFDRPTPEFIADYLNSVRTNGLAYIDGLGVNVRRIEVKSVDPIGKLAAASEEAAIQEMERIGTFEEVKALAEAAELLRSKAGAGADEIPFAELVEMVQVDKKKSRVSKEIFKVDADTDGLLAAGLAKFAGNKKGK